MIFKPKLKNTFTIKAPSGRNYRFFNGEPVECRASHDVEFLLNHELVECGKEILDIAAPETNEVETKVIEVKTEEQKEDKTKKKKRKKE